MAPRPQRPPTAESAPAESGRRAGLLPYILHPETFPRHVVIRATPHTVLVRDLFPKATVHLLLLPRSPAHRTLNPRDAFADGAFLRLVQSEAAGAAALAAAELKRLVSTRSATVGARRAAEDAEDAAGAVPDDEAALPPDRDFAADVRVGVHAHPSMRHLHVHVISRDMCSDKVRHRRHYNSFNTPFFLPLADFPLAPDDERRESRFQNANLARDLVCWRCGRGFGSRFAELKEHLDVEFDAWSRI
ncbi:hypothetical protein P8C59_003431 [Phyllachora maydis]|uniref:Aprataxin n=1 Tax=Phyllachora maydis TaxID=1825666 RepID=A0AAD9I0D9_9PEZI|nr:hypothetical protein P8C59_003431 [Phyllachora maydis]